MAHAAHPNIIPRPIIQEIMTHTALTSMRVNVLGRKLVLVYVIWMNLLQMKRKLKFKLARVGRLAKMVIQTICSKYVSVCVVCAHFTL